MFESEATRPPLIRDSLLCRAGRRGIGHGSRGRLPRIRRNRKSHDAHEGSACPERDLGHTCGDCLAVHRQCPSDWNVDMTGQQVHETNDALLDVAEQLTNEYADVLAGSVLRCLARASRQAREWGCPLEHLPSTAAATARWMLDRRYASNPSTAV